jgi:hypothetical protein
MTTGAGLFQTMMVIPQQTFDRLVAGKNCPVAELGNVDVNQLNVNADEKVNVSHSTPAGRKKRPPKLVTSKTSPLTPPPSSRQPTPEDGLPIKTDVATSPIRGDIEEKSTQTGRRKVKARRRFDFTKMAMDDLKAINPSEEEKVKSWMSAFKPTFGRGTRHSSSSLSREALGNLRELPHELEKGAGKGAGKWINGYSRTASTKLFDREAEKGAGKGIEGLTDSPTIVQLPSAARRK